MGMYDTVCFTCPACDSPLEVQSKAGSCTLSMIDSMEVPLGIADNIVGEHVQCDSCNKTFRVFMPVRIATVQLSLGRT